MKLVLALLFPVLAFADPASSLAGKTATLRDEKGKASTTSSTSGTKTTFRDAQGRMTGTATQSSTGKTTFRDAQGRTTGTSTTNGTKTTCRDAQGRITGTSSTSSSGVTTYRDPSGRSTASEEIDLWKPISDHFERILCQEQPALSLKGQADAENQGLKPRETSSNFAEIVTNFVTKNPILVGRSLLRH